MLGAVYPSNTYVCINVCVCVLHTYRRVKQLTVKIKSNNRAHTHTQTLPFTHTCTHTHSSTHSLSCSTSPFLSLSHSLALQHNEGNWAESLPLAVFCNLPCGGGGGRALQQATTSASTQQVAAQHYARQSSAALLVLAAVLAALPFRISHSTSWRSERGSVHRLVRRSQLTFSARWNLVADGRVFVSTVPQFHHSASASAASSRAAPQQTLVALRRRRSPISASRICSLNNS